LIVVRATVRHYNDAEGTSMKDEKQQLAV
jgi:hypothetical protein